MKADNTYYSNASLSDQPNNDTFAKINAETRVRNLLAANFVSVPDLVTFGIFEGNVTSLLPSSSQEGLRTTSTSSGFEVVLEQRNRVGRARKKRTGLTLTVFDSNIYAYVSPDGTVVFCSVVFYDIQPNGVLKRVVRAKKATKIACRDFLERFPGKKCHITYLQPYQGAPKYTVTGSLEVRPVWAIGFSRGKQVYTLDAITGDILEVDDSRKRTRPGRRWYTMICFLMLIR